MKMTRKLHMIEWPNFLVSLSLYSIEEISHLYRSDLLNSVAGLFIILINVYTVQSETWFVTARITAIVTDICADVMLNLFLIYSVWLLD